MKRTKLKIVGDNDTAILKQEIQYLVRLICAIRDGGCILRNVRHCGGAAVVEGEEIISNNVIQADHLITRGNSATFADTRLIVCLCKNCHAWKSVGNNMRKDEYDILVKTLISKDRVELWERCEADMHAHKTFKPDWRMSIVVLKQELLTLT